MSSLRIVLIGLLISVLYPTTPWVQAFEVPQGRGGFQRLKPGPNPFRESGSLTCCGSTNIDVNGDGATAGLVTFEAQSNLGPISGQEVGEGILLPALLNCSPETYELEFSLVMTQGAKRISNGDLLFYEYTAGTTCADLDTWPITFSFFGEANFTGGTGVFAGASGDFEVTANGTVLVLDPAGNGFTANTFDVTGTIILPE